MWSDKRTAGTQLGWSGLPAVLFIVATATLLLLQPGRLIAEDGNEGAAQLRAALGIRNVLEIEFFAESGNAYTVEAKSADGVWSDIYGPVYGQGEIIRDHVRAAGGFLAYRLKIGDIAAGGDAPEGLEGHSYSLNYGTRLTSLHFASADAGVATGQDGVQLGFSYTYLKSRPDRGELSIDYADGLRETLALTFWHGRVGIFESTAARGDRRAHKSSGTFRAGDDVNPDNAVPPLTLEGSKFIFRDRGMTSVITFTTDFSGSLARQGGDTEVISYTYDISSWPEASLTLSFPGSDEVHEYTMNFIARNAGAFFRRIIKGGKVTDTDRGKFSGKGADDKDDDGKGGGNTETECLAPLSLKGRTLQAWVGEEAVTILLDGSRSGHILKKLPHGRVALQSFTYVYKKEGDKEGLLTITLPTGGEDEVQVFELDFTSTAGGRCVRKRYEGEALDDTDKGPFKLSDDDWAGEQANQRR